MFFLKDITHILTPCFIFISVILALYAIYLDSPTHEYKKYKKLNKKFFKDHLETMTLIELKREVDSLITEHRSDILSLCTNDCIKIINSKTGDVIYYLSKQVIRKREKIYDKDTDKFSYTNNFIIVLLNDSINYQAYLKMLDNVICSHDYEGLYIEDVFNYVSHFMIDMKTTLYNTEQGIRKSVDKDMDEIRDNSKKRYEEFSTFANNAKRRRTSNQRRIR